MLEVALENLASELPICRQTMPDGPNEWQLPQWTIPLSIEALGNAAVVELEQARETDHIRFRRPRLTEIEAVIALEMPDQTRTYYLRTSPFGGWSVQASH